MKLVVTGDRHYLDVPMLWQRLDEINNQIGPITLLIDGASDDVTGPYSGADYWSHQWALARNIPTARAHAKWKEQGRAAGPIRNGEMLKKYNPDRLLAFPGGRGTANMVEQAEKAGLVVHHVRP